MDIKKQYQIMYYLNIVKCIIKNQYIIINLNNKYKKKMIKLKEKYKNLMKIINKYKFKISECEISV